MSRNVLIVDDSAVMRKIIMRSLRQANVQVDQIFEAGDGAEGLKVLAEQSVDLVLSDVNMPNVDGFEFVRRARSQTPPIDVPIVMVTTEGSEDRVKEALSSGVQGYVVKPFTADDLREALAGVGI
jgi:two-component system, chemotaxis family, chemotaxis protein CheY